MADKKQYAPRKTTPVGTLRYPHVNKADGKFNPEKPRYKAPLILTAAEAQPIIDAIEADEKFGLPAARVLRDAAAAAAKKAGKKLPPAKDPANAAELLPYSAMVDPDTGAENGMVLVSIGGNDRYKKADGTVVMLTVKFFDAKGQEIPASKKPEVWGGTRARVSYSHFAYYNAATNEYGVSLRLEAVKIIELKSGGSGADAGSYGFGDEEEGYSPPASDSMEGDESGAAAPPGLLPNDADF